MFPRRPFSLALALSLLLSPLGLAPATAAPSSCTELTIPAALEPNSPADHSIYAKLCRPGAATGTVQLLVAGATYDHTYWDLPDPAGQDRYSYVSAALRAGQATVAIDRIGIGRSSHPPGALLTLARNAFVLAQVVRAVRAEGFARVVLVGHSLGTMISWLTASRYQGVDALVLTGATHQINPQGTLNLMPRLLNPAPLDAGLRPPVSDPAYLTSIPGERDQMFHKPAVVDPELLHFDEQHKQTVTANEWNTIPLALAEPLDLRVPVFLVIGAWDSAFCGVVGTDCRSAETVVAGERASLGARVPSVAGFVLAEAGHCLNYARNAADYHAATQRWIRATLG